MNNMSFYEFRSEKTGSGSRSQIFMENKIVSLTNSFQQYIKDLSEREIELLQYFIAKQTFLNIYICHQPYQTLVKSCQL